MEKLKKFFINKKVKISILIVDVLLAVLYVVFLYILNNATKLNILEDSNSYQLIELANQFILVAFSIITTTLFSSWLIDVKEKNDIYKEAVCNDFLASPEFYNALGEEQKRAILNSFEDYYYFNGSDKKEEMYDSITNKLTASGDIYYDDCKYDIDCIIDGNYIIKEITRTTKLFAYNNCQKKSLHLITSVFGTDNNVRGFTLESVEINGQSLNLEKDLYKEELPVTDISLKKCGYNKTVKYSYNKKIEIKKQKSNNDQEKLGVVVIIKYRTVVRKNDASYVCRVKYPCKHFTLNFRLNGNSASNYELAAHSFGFIDKGNNSTNQNNRNVANIEFDNWIFETDGVTIVISEKA